MGYLQGLQNYLDESYHVSVFDKDLEERTQMVFHMHGRKKMMVRILENLTYDVRCDVEGTGEQILQKVEIKMLYPADMADPVASLIKEDKEVKNMALEPIFSPRKRYHIKNKTLFPLMQDRQVLFFTLLEGEVIKGIISGFSRYEITLNMKGGIPVTILRHSIYDLRDKKGRCFLKSKQEELRDWEKSPLYVETPDEAH